jgi:hypothetical protein
VGDDVTVDSDALLVTDFMNLKIKSAQSFRCAHRGRVCVRVFIWVNARTYMSIGICTVFLKKDIRILRCGGYMKNSGGSDNNLVTDEVQINLDVLGVLMLHRVSQEINDTYVITVNNSSSMKRGVKFFK